MMHRYTVQDHIQRGEILAKSGLFDCTRAEQGQGISIFCEDSGITLAEFRNKFHFANGLMQPRAGYLLAEFNRAGGKHKWIKDGSDGQSAEIELTDTIGNVTKAAFTMEEAIKRKLVKKGGNWESIPGEMLRARAITKAINMAMPGLGYIESDTDSEPAPLPPKPETQPRSEPLSLPEKPAVEPPPVTEKQPVAPVPATPKKAKAIEKAESKPEPVADDSNRELIPTEKPEKPTLSDELVEQLESALEGCEMAASEFFIKNKWLEKGEGIACLKEPQARRILNHVDSFIKSIGGPF